MGNEEHGGYGGAPFAERKFAGFEKVYAGHGGMAFACTRCGASISDQMFATHREWHDQGGA